MGRRKKREVDEALFKARKRACELLLAGKPTDVIVEETGLDKSTIGGLKRYLTDPAFREKTLMKYGLKAEALPEALGKEAKGKEVEEPPKPSEDEVEKGLGVLGSLGSELGYGDIGLRETPPFTREPLGPGEVEVGVSGIPVGRRLQLTPWILVMFDWFKTRKGYEGDLSDFIHDAVVDFFKARGYTLKVVKEEEKEEEELE